MLGLNGTGIHEPDLLADPGYILRIDRYFSHLQQVLRDRSSQEFRDTITVPEEFRILPDHVLMLTGPGLTKGSKS
ncbi:hypothetical protein Ct61P_15363 [Colletotrichum tofieldiae]|nr:hypothetical protein Ct61P_15363 [Colletotrichum tofieldiae]